MTRYSEEGSRWEVCMRKRYTKPTLRKTGKVERLTLFGPSPSLTVEPTQEPP